MNGDRTIMVEILNAIEHGTLSVHETRRRLEDLIDKEIQNADAPANMQLVEECERLLWELNTDGKLSYVSHKKDNMAAVLRRIHNRKTICLLKKYSFRVCSAAAAMFILVIGIEAIMHREWFDSYSTDDEQAYIIEGQISDPSLIQEGTADDNAVFSEFSTQSISEATAFLNYSFSLPGASISDWYIDEYYCAKSPSTLELFAYYTNHNKADDVLMIKARHYNNVEDAFISFEQNEEGYFLDHRGYSLYVSENIERTSHMWRNDTDIYIIDGNITTSEAIQIFDMIVGGAK